MWQRASPLFTLPFHISALSIPTWGPWLFSCTHILAPLCYFPNLRLAPIAAQVLLPVCSMCPVLLCLSLRPVPSHTAPAWCPPRTWSRRASCSGVPGLCTRGSDNRLP